MKKHQLFQHFILIFAILLSSLAISQTNEEINSSKERYEKFLNEHPFNKHEKKTPKQWKETTPKCDRPDLMMEREYLMTLDPNTGTVPRERLADANIMAEQILSQKSAIAGVSWTERGPNNVGGRVRALMFDPNDAANGYKKVWAGSVSGGLWYNNDITDENSSWNRVYDFWDNIAIGSIAYDPNNTQVFYVGTGEGYDSRMVKGLGIMRSTDGGASWSYLTATKNNNFSTVQKIVVKGNGNVFAATNTGVYKSTDQGLNWTAVWTGTVVADMELASNGDLYASMGWSYTQPANLNGIYKSPNASNGNAGTWTRIWYDPNHQRIEMASAPSNSGVLYFVAQGTSSGIDNGGGVYRTDNGGANWYDITEPNDDETGLPDNDFTRGQAFYDLIIKVDPANANNVYIAGINMFRSTDAGINWSQISKWTDGRGQAAKPYSIVHSDNHACDYAPGNSSRAIFGNDGGVWYCNNINNAATSANIKHRVKNFNITQFYSCAANPTNNSNNFLAGAQDNGTQRFLNIGVNSTSEASGGDGMYCFIDQDNPMVQIASYTNNTFYISNNGGLTFPQLSFDETGSFLNPCDYDDRENILFSYRDKTSLKKVYNVGTNNYESWVGTSNLGTDATHIRVSPYAPTGSSTVFIGTAAGKIFKLTNAGSSSPSITGNIAGNINVGSISCIEIGATENDLLVTLSNYGVNSVWQTSNGGANWYSKEGNLPDMPIRWALYNPDNRSQVLLATEVGVWSTNDVNAANPDWQPTNTSLANVRCDMLQYRASDKVVVVATWGRGLFTTDIFSTPTADFEVDKIISYIGNTIQFSDGSLKASSWSWNFGDGNTSILKNPTHAYTVAGVYNVTLTINSGASTKTKNAYIQILPTKTPPYLAANGGNFETNVNDFSSVSVIGSVNLWERGVPGNTLTTVSSPTNAWKTLLNANVTKGNYSCALLTPNFNLSATGQYVLKFKKSMEHYYGNAPYAVQVHYSTDKGLTWNRLGTHNDANGTNWYNKNPSEQYPIDDMFFNGEKIGWLTNVNNQNTEYNISSLSGQSNVAFRIIMEVGSYSDNAYKDGFMVDDFEITYQGTTADFTCTKPLSYINANVQFTDASISATSWSWNFGDGNTSTSQNPTNAYSAPGKYTVTLSINSGASTKTKTNYIHILPNKNIPYSTADGGNFETNADDFGSVALTGNKNIWERGVPGSVLNTAPSPTNVWKTALTTIVPDPGYNYSCALVTPNYNMAVAGAYTLKFTKSMRRWYGNGPYAVQVQYTTDKGATWTRLGAYNDGNGTGWYNMDPNGSTQMYAPLFNGEKQGWIDWVDNQNTEYNISFLAGQADVSFRFVLHVISGFPADGYKDGFLVDDFQVLGPPSVADVTAPVVATLSPTNGASNIISNSNISITFDENIQKGTGNIVIKEGGIATQTIPVGNANVTISGKTLTIDPSNFTNAAQVNVEMTSGVIKDITGNNFAGLNSSAWVFTISNQPPAYCTSTATSPDDSRIDKVVFGSIDNNSTTSGCVTYTNFTNLTADVAPLQAVPLSIILGSCSAGNYWKDSETYIDWNGDGDFDDAGDLVATSDLHGNGTFNTTVTVPANATPGYTRMRIVCTEKTSSQTQQQLLDAMLPCGTYSYGETEDYTIRILSDAVAPTASSYTPTNGAVDVTISSNLSVVFSENIQKGTGNIIIKENSTTTQTIPVGNANVTIAGNTLTIDPANFSNGVNVSVEIASGVIKDMANNNFAGISTGQWAFNTVQPDIILADFTTNKTQACDGQQVTFTNQSSGTVNTYSWNFGDGATPATASTAGPHNVTYNTAGMKTVSLSVTGPAGSNTSTKASFVNVFKVVITSTVTNVLCNGAITGSVSLTSTGGTTPYSYVWNTAQTTSAISNVVAGTYTVTATDGLQCSATGSFTVTQPNAIAVTISKHTNISCFGGNNGALEILVNGGVAPYTYLWSNGSTSQNISNLSPGTYTVTVKDANNCTKTNWDVVSQPDQLSSVVQSSSNPSCSTNTGSINTSTSGGTSPYTYLWSNGSTTANISNLGAGSFTLTATDSKLCTATTTATLTPPGAPTLTIGSKTNVSCFGGSNGVINTVITGGTPAYTYIWSNSGTSQNATGLIAGNYTVTVTDANSCSYSLTTSITQPAELGITLVSKSDVSCNAGNNGAINISVAGGTSPYTYNWSNGKTTQNNSGIVAGNYSVTATDANNCTKIATYTISQPDAISITIKNIQHVTCKGGANGSVSFNITGGTQPYTYNWSSTIPPPPSNGVGGIILVQSYTNLNANAYQIIATDVNGCSSNFSTLINEPSQIVGTIASQTNPSCSGGSNGTVNLSVSGGTTPYTYIWSTGAITQNITGASAGTYTVTTTDANNCQISISATVTEPSLLSASIASQTNVSCAGLNNGSIDLSVSGGTSPYTYSWSNSATTQDLSNISAGTYSVTSTDSKGCTKTTSATITEANAMSLTATATNVSCNGTSTGSANLTVTGGTAPYTYQWSNNASTQNITNLNAGTYSVTVTSQGGCTATKSITITQPAPIAVTLASQTNVTGCGVSDGAININVSGGTNPYTYSWSNGSTTQNLSNIAAGPYTVTVSDNNSCTKTFTATITQPSPLSVSLNTKTNVLCNAGTNGQIDINVSGGTTPYTYNWSNSATTEDITGLNAGSYSVTVTDAGSCSYTYNTSISQPLALLASVASQQNVSCTNGSDGSIIMTVTGGTPNYNYNWSNSFSTKDISGIGQGSYTVTITDALGCQTTTSATITEPTQLSATASVTNVLCNAGSNGAISLSVSGGISPYTFIWSNNATTQNISSLTSGNYSVTITDNNSCRINQNNQVTQPQAISATTNVTNMSCGAGGSQNGSINLSVAGGTSPFTYLWLNSTTTQNATNLTSGSYTVTITDANACTKIASATVTQPPSVVISINTKKNPPCFGGNNGMIDISVTGGNAPYTYTWSNGIQTQDLLNLIAGTYTVVVTDNSGCNSSMDIILTEPQDIATSVTPINVTCNGLNNGSATISVTGGTAPYTYNWPYSAGTAASASNLSANVYNVTITDAVQCVKVPKITITQPDALATSIMNTTNVITCGGSEGSVNINISGGTVPYTYSWSNGANTQNISNLVAGTYSVTVSDVNNCSQSLTATITQPSSLSSSFTQVNVICNGGNNGSVDLSVSGGTSPYTYNWSNGIKVQDLSNLTAGNYNVTITDASSCTYSAGTVITQPATLIANIVNRTDVSCYNGNNGAINIDVIGGTSPYTYIWNNGASTQDLINLTAGNYSITVTDLNLCSTQLSSQINQSSQLSVSVINTLNNICFGGNNGAVTIDINGGATPYTYLWSNSLTVQNPNSLVSGPYTVTVTDANACTTTTSATITQPQQLVATVKTITNVSCNNGSNGAIELNVTGGLAPYIYNWSNGAASINNNNIIAGTYTVTVKDANGCNSIINATITQPSQALSLQATATDAGCQGANNGSVNLTVSGGTSPYTYAWSNTSTTEDITGLSAGNYTVTVSDSKLCNANTFAIVEQASSITINANSNNIACNGDNNGSVNLVVSGGTNPYTYVWSNSATTKDISGLSAGSYTVTVNDSNGCSNTSIVSITEPVVLSESTSVTNSSSCGTSDGAIDLTINGGVTPYTYSWSNGVSTQDLSSIPAGQYYVTITDANNCRITQNVVVTQPGTLSSVISESNVSCNGGNDGAINLTVSGGVSPYTYAWSNSATTEDISGINAGNYNVTINDNGGCQLLLSIDILQPNSLGLILNITNVACYSNSTGAINLSVNGGNSPYTYLWSNGNTTQNISSLNAGSYSVTVTDANGCSSSNNANISQPSPFTANILSRTDVTCFGASNGTVNISVNGGTAPYTYLWTGGSTSQNRTGLTAGTYNVTVTDANACTATNSVTISEPTAISVTDVIVNVTVNGGNDGSIALTVSGGTLPYNYNWSNFAITEDLTVLTAGNYDVTITDANGCTSTNSYVVNQPSETVYCSGTTNLATSTGSFSDGSTTNNYSNNADCKWLIQVTNASSITLTFTAFDLAQNDGVRLYDGADANANLLGTYSGSTIPGAISSSGSSLFVEFITDANTTAAGWDADYTSTIPTVFCSGTTTLTTSTGSFSDGSTTNDYLENSDCSWLIEPAGATSVTISFTEFSTESSYDLVNIYDGENVNAPLLASYSGSSIPADVTSSGGKMFVNFTSDFSVNASGWSADYTSSTVVTNFCNANSTLTDASGTFNDGSASANYKNVTDCSWLIQPASATAITLGFTSFATENGIDFVNVYEGIDETGTLIASYSGINIPNEITATGSSMFVNFVSDSVNTNSGWDAYWFTDTTAVDNFCSGTTTISDPTATFSDGSGIKNYLDYTNCKWAIQPAGATYIKLDFSEFDTESGYDFVSIYEGTDSLGNLIGEFSGNAIPQTVTVLGSSMFVQFTTDNIVNSTGWEATYTAYYDSPTYCQPLTTLTDATGTFSDGSGMNNYMSLSDCQWLIQPANAAYIVLDFTAFNTEAGYDSVVVYDGDNTSAPVLMTWWGDTIPPQIYSTGGSMLVYFKSDNGIDTSGWDASYTSQVATASYCTGLTTLTDATGTLSDGSGTNDYGENADCQWLIQPAGAQYITLDFTAFSTEQDYDFVKVYQGIDETAPLLATLSGSSLPSQITALGGSMYIRFTSDYAINSSGWDATYTSSTDAPAFCNSLTTLTAETGTFGDGSGLSDYLENSNCKWLIQPANATSITLTFTEFIIENNYDFVYVYDGADTTATLLGTYTGATIPAPLTSSGGSMLVKFNSDADVNAPGWNTDYTSVIAPSYFCSGTTTLTTITGSFSDGSGTEDYLEYSNCKWLIQPSGATNVTLHFTALDVENGYDYVYVYDGADSTSTLLAAYTGNSIPASVSSSGSSMFVQFISDYTVNAAGWDAYYDTTYVATTSYCSGQTTLTDATGSFSDGSDASNYLDNSNCQWLIQPVGATRINLTFTSFDIESGYDFVNVYDGSDNTASLLGSYSGSSIPSMITTTGGAMFVEFTSDVTVNSAGWEADYEALFTNEPVANFSGTPTTIIEGMSVNFTDLSTQNPTSWEWTFNGGSPASSSLQNPTNITYATAGTYDVTLVAINYDGSDTLTIADYITVIVAGGGGDTLNYPLPGTPYCSYINGNNVYGDLAKANYFDSFGGNNQLDGVIIDFCYLINTVGTGTATVGVWDNSGVSGSPGTLIATEVVNMSDLELDYNNSQSSYIQFSSPIGVTGPIYAGVILPDATLGDTLLITSNSDGDTDPGTAWELFSDGTTWANITTSWGINEALAVYPVMSVSQCFMGVSLTTNHITCNSLTNGNVTTDIVNGTAPYTYLWSDATTNSGIVNLSAGTYDITVTDGNGCVATNSATVIEPSAITLSSSITDESAAGNDGAIDLTVTGGVGPYSFDWGSATTEDLTGLTAGNYDVTVIDYNLCSTTDIFTVNGFTCSLTSSISGLDVSCNGGSTGSATITVSNATMPITYLWSNGQTTQSATSLIAGIYSVTATDANSCTITDAITTTEPLAISITYAVTDETVTGNDGAIDITVSGGTVPYSYYWTNGAFTQDLTGLTAGAYDVTVTDFNLCTATSSIVVNGVAPCTLSAIYTGTDASCNGLNDGEANVVASNGTTPYTYLWSTGGASATLSNLIAGTYSVTVTDASSCTVTDAVTISEPTALSITYTVTDETVAGNDGAIDLTVSGSITPYTFDWSNLATSEDLTGIIAGTYDVTVTDFNLCTAISSILVNGVAPCTLSAIASATDVSCNAGNDGLADVVASNGTTPYTYLWSDGGASASLSNLIAGTYSVTVTDASNCTVTDAVTISEPTALSITYTVTDETVAGNDGAIDLTVTGGITPYTFDWSNLATSEDLTGIIAGTYDVTVTDFNGCTSTETIVVNGITPCTLSAIASATDVSCNAGNDGQAFVVASNGTTPYTYLWSDGGASATLSNLTAGTYSVTVTDASSCTVTDAITISEPTALSITYTVINETVAGNDGAIDISLSGGNPPFAFVWSNGATTEDISGLSANVYTVTVIDDNICTTTESIVVNIIGGSSTDTIGYPISGTLICSYVNGNNSYGDLAKASYFDAASSVGYTDIEGILFDFCYVTNTSGTGTATVAIWDNSGTGGNPGAAPIATATVNLSDVINDISNSQSTYVQFSSAVTIPGAFYAGVILPNDVNGDSLMITSNSNGDTNPGTAWELWSDGTSWYDIASSWGINEAMAIYPVLSTTPCTMWVYADATDISCNGANDGTANVDVYSGTIPYTYSWSNGGALASLSNLSAGTYTVTVTDGNGCSDIGSATVSEPSAISLSYIVTDENLGNDGAIALTVSGGTASYTFDWSNLATTQDLSGLTAGTYNVTVTDANSCTANASIVVNYIAPCTLTASISVFTDVNCNAGNDGTATVTASNGTTPYTYLWSSIQITATATDLIAGTYSVTVTDANSCTASANVTISEPLAISLSFVVTDESVAGNDGAVDLSVSGGTPSYSFLWSNGEFTEDLTTLIANTYYVTVTDANGCTTVGSAVVNSLVVTITVDTLNYPITGTPSCSYVNGNNSYGDLAKANYFDASSFIGFTKIEGLLIDFCYATGSGNASIAIWDNSGTASSPGSSPIASETLSISNVINDIGNTQSTYVQFAQQVEIPGSFYAGVVLPTVAGDSLIILSNSNGDTNPGIAWEQWSSGSWYTVAYGWSINEAMAIYPVINDEAIFVSNVDFNSVVVLYPNPSRGLVNIASNNTIKIVTVIDGLGRVVENQNFYNDKVIINTADFATGIYVVRIETTTGVTTKKLQVLNR